MSCRLSCVLAVVLGMFLTPVCSRGQAFDPKKLKAVADIKGTIKAIDGNAGVVQLTDAAGKPIFVKMMPDTKISIDATAEPEFLNAGVVVDFTAECDAKGQVKGEIAELRICELTNTVQPAFNPSEFGKSFDPKNKDMTMKCFVRGTIVSAKDGELQIKANNTLVKGKLGASPKITVSVTDYRLAQEGDTLTVQLGREFQPGQIVGENVNIKCVQPLAPKKKGAAARKKPVTK